MASIVNTKGVDISYWNGDIDLSKVKAAGYQWVMIRCGFGNDTTNNDDSRFEANVRKAEAIGMPWGAYFYTYSLNATQDQSELNHILRLLKGKKPTMPIAIDVEDADGYKSKNGGWNYSNVNRNAKFLLEGIAKAGYYPMLYTGFEEIENYISKEVWQKYDMWFAHWAKKCGYNGSNLAMWQYGGETNLIDGNSISGVGTIDKDMVYKDYPTIIKNGGYNGWAKQSGGSSSTSSSTSGTTTQTGSTTSVAVPDVTYRVRAGGKWWGEIKNTSDYAGVIGKAITDVVIKVSKGSVKYRVHVNGGGWLGWITDYNINNSATGYAGNGKPIDAIEVYYYTPSDVVKSQGYLRATYRVSPVNGNYYDWQHDNETTNGQDGYAGDFGRNIDRLQIKLAK